MMKYELEHFWKGFIGEIDFIVELDSNEDETPTGIIDAEYYMDAHGTGHIKLIPASILTRKL